MYQDHEFDPTTPQEQAQREQDEELARRVRREVLRVQRGEADQDIHDDQEREAAKHAEQEAQEQKTRKRDASTFWQLFSGSILLHKQVSGYYPFLFAIAGMFFLSILVFFTSLHQDRKYARMERETQMLRERSIRLQEQRYRTTSHSAIVARLRERGLDLYDPLAPGQIIEN